MRASGRPLRLPATAFAGLLALAAACGEAPPQPGQVGGPAPDYPLLTMEGDSLSLADMRGDVVLLNLWATWCPPCRKETPELEALHRELADRGLRVVGVSVDAPGSEEAVRAFLEEFGVTYRILRDPAEHGYSAFGAYGVPITVLVDRGGTVRWRHLGPVTRDDPGLRAALEAALSGGGPAAGDAGAAG